MALECVHLFAFRVQASRAILAFLESIPSLAWPHEEAMNLSALPDWAITLLLILLFAVALATSHLLGPSEDEAIQASADIDASLAAMFAASKGPQ